MATNAMTRSLNITYPALPLHIAVRAYGRTVWRSSRRPPGGAPYHGAPPVLSLGPSTHPPTHARTNACMHARTARETGRVTSKRDSFFWTQVRIPTTNSRHSSKHGAQGHSVSVCSGLAMFLPGRSWKIQGSAAAASFKICPMRYQPQLCT